ncbi:hypothetical protein [Chromobacterium sp. IIBBL 290-4]|uniref:hypothetical protein n=1 Tax=Chromobacterium sp. IIBBL 290-4 TaxID=2953890 RepID=UPI0020B72D4B|nr:hypothetical protein [Chromobacterium sp. IIBBL 290-4]UTH75316.1 hypothetical protein NKT35_04225 [Chromobacterium sp. IIBBL 290-4]
MAAAKAQQQGHSLIEALLALAIWMLGMSGLFSLQAKTLQQSRDIEQLAAIEQAASELIAMAQTMPAQEWKHFQESGYDDHLDGAATCLSGCSAQQRAAFQLWRFKQSLRSGRGAQEAIRAAVCRSDGKQAPSLASDGCGGSGPLGIRVAWRSRNGKAWHEQSRVWPLSP